MIEIRYGDQFEISDLAGQTIGEAREQFKAEFGIPDKASARLNGSKVKSHAEIDTVINDDDKLTFAVSHSRTPFLVGALLLALAVTGSVFAFGWINATTTISATVGNNFADVYASNNLSGWTANGNTKGNIGEGNIFTITPDPTYTGDLVVTVSIGNAADLAQQYRVLSFQLELVQSDNVTTIDLSASNGVFWTLLDLNNGKIDLYPATTQNMSVRVKGGFYITKTKGTGPWGGASAPQLFCEVTQGAMSSPAPLTVANQVSYYSLNFNSVNFTRSLTPMSWTAGGASASQSINPDGSVVLTINNSLGYADSGFYLYSGTLGNLNNITIQASSGSGPFSVNLWFDRDNDGETFNWISDVYQGVGNDAYICGSSSLNDILTVSAGSLFNSLIPGGGSYTLAQLKSGAAPGINSNTKIAIWVGIAVNSGSQNATIQYLSIS